MTYASTGSRTIQGIIQLKEYYANEFQIFLQAYAEPEDDNVSLNAFAWIAKSQQTVVVGKNDYSVGVVDIRSGYVT